MHSPQPDDTPPRSRPLSVWLISGWYFLSGLFSINMIAMVQSRLSADAASAAVAADAAAMPLAKSDIFLAAFLIAVNLSGAGFLFFLKKAAVVFFRAAIVLNVGINIWYVVTKGTGDHPLILFVSVVLGWLVAIAVCRHAEHLARTGVLR